MQRCRYCHRRLKDAESIARGIGPVCYGRIRKKDKRPKKSVALCADTEETITIDEWLSSQKGSEVVESSSFYNQEYGVRP